MAKTPKKKAQPHSTAKKPATNKRQPNSVGDPPACGCTGAEIAGLLAAYLYQLAGAETGDTVNVWINGAGEWSATTIPTDGRAWIGGPNGPGWVALNQEDETATVVDAAKNENTSEGTS